VLVNPVKLNERFQGHLYDIESFSRHTPSIMAWSKSTRITIMLAIDVVFFLVELIVGMYVGSMALMADAFHMVGSRL